MGLIPRFYDVTAGRLLVDGIDVRHLHLDDLRRNIGPSSRRASSFPTRSRPTSPSATPTPPRPRSRRPRGSPRRTTSSSAPKGYETVLGESGNSLSGGQRQRLAIARAVLLEPAILLLDDPTAAIDSETEHEIFEALDRAIAGARPSSWPTA
jgi:ATP-binding cassette subfamily B protein